MSQIGKVEEKLNEEIEQGRYYDAQQSYKILYHRFKTKGQFKKALDLAYNGALKMLQFKQQNCGGELGLLLLELYNEKSVKVNMASAERIVAIFDAFDEENTTAKISFMKEALKWSKPKDELVSQTASQEDKLLREKEREEASKVYSHLQTKLALAYMKKKEYGKSSPHFLLGNDPEHFAEMLILWSKEGLESEKDMFIARATLQTLCFGKRKEAETIYNIFMKDWLQSSEKTPLLNYVDFLLQTLQRENSYPLFQLLQQKYAKSLQRDNEFSQYLEHIAKVYYNVQPQKNFFSQMLQSFLGGGDDN